MINVWNNAILDDEIRKVQWALQNRKIMEGSVLLEFEERLKDILKVRYTIGVASGSAALALALMGIGLKPGDEVIVPDITFIATANAPYMLGAKVILAPTLKNVPLLDIDVLDDLITDRTKAIIPVSLNGRLVASKELVERYEKRGIYIIEDACQAFMSSDENGRAGTNAHIGCFSFGITKTLTTAKGGLVVTNDEELFRKMKLIKMQGMDSVFDGDYLYPGFNFKLPDILAAIGLAQLNRIQEKMDHMRQIDCMYQEGLREIEGIEFIPRGRELLWMSDILCKNRVKVQTLLREHNIMCRPLYKPLHYAAFLECEGEFENAVELQNNVLYLPSGPDQDYENVERTIHVLQNEKLI
ncbi:MAG: aminotransferase class I/II-fold pyridoxal phosphate-dependent enzyme [Ruminococcus flavefaciens]|nr:aminotransferase class I/II-fold pyridoxal phosphate-dependent enzyme [Ruminococcus flavefaciens]